MPAKQEQIDQVVQLVLDNWEAIGVEEHDGILHLPAAIKRRDKAGGIKETPVRLRNITNPQRYRSRTESRSWAGKLSLDLDRDRDLIDQLENYCILAFAIRDPETYVQHVPDAETLFRMYEPASIAEIWGRYDAWCRMLHPSFGEFTAEQFWQCIARIKGSADITFLAGWPGTVQASWLVFTAREAALSPNAPSWLRSSETSTPAPSASLS